MLSDNESNWIVGAQIPAGHGEATGAIRFHPDPIQGTWQVAPHDANIAAWGVLHGGDIYGPAARTWLQWYMNHMDPETGYVCDYTIDTSSFAVDPILTPFGTRYYDSTDATSASFLTACRKYVETTGDAEFLRANNHAVWGAVRAMESTRQSCGLTWAAPDRAVKFLSNNCARYQALQDVSWMCANVYADQVGDKPPYAAEAVAAGTEIMTRFWDHSHDMFVVALDRDDGATSAEWGVWNSAIAQMWPVLVTLDLWPDEFDAAWPLWTSATTTPAPAAMVAFVAALTGRHDAAREWLRSARHTFTNNGHTLPWTVKEAAFTVATAWMEGM